MTPLVFVSGINRLDELEAAPSGEVEPTSEYDAQEPCSKCGGRFKCLDSFMDHDCNEHRAAEEREKEADFYHSNMFSSDELIDEITAAKARIAELEADNKKLRAALLKADEIAAQAIGFEKEAKARLSEAEEIIDANRWPDTAAKLLREAEALLQELMATISLSPDDALLVASVLRLAIQERTQTPPTP